jgi:hypothetical protein
MVNRRASVLVLGGLLLLAGRGPVRADDAAAFAASTVADLIAHGTEVERLWGRHALDRLPTAERTRALELIEWHEKRQDDAEGRRREPGLPNLRVSLRLRYCLAPRVLLTELGVDLQGLLRSSPPYPSEAERRAGSPMLEARPDVEVLARLDAAIEDGRLRVVGTAESEGRVGALQTLSVLAPADVPRPGEQGAPPSGAVLHVQPYFTGPPRLGSLSIRRIVATRRVQDEEPGLQIVGSSHPLDPSWGLHVPVRDGEVLLLSPRWAVDRAWTGGVLPVLVLTCRALPQPASCVIDVRPGRGPLLQRHFAPVGEVRDDGTRVVFQASQTDRFFFGERLTVARGAAQEQYVTVIEVVGIRGTRIEARSVPLLQKHAIEAGDHVAWFTSPRR